MTCPTCKGYGEVMNGYGFRGQEWWIKCPTCQGDCEVPDPPAPEHSTGAAMKHENQRFSREGRKVFDREKSSHGTVYCEARSGHAADVIQLALNSWHGMGPARTLPKWVKKRIAKRKAGKGSNANQNE